METDSRQSTSPDASVFPGIEDLKKLIEKFQLPNVDIDALIDWQRKDMEALIEANRQASEGLKALVERQRDPPRNAGGMASGSQRRHKRRGDHEANRGRTAKRTEGDREFPRAFRDGSAIA